MKRRVVANQLCKQGYIIVNGRPAKPSTLVKPGDRLRLEIGQKVMVVEVIAPPPESGKRREGMMYRLLEEGPGDPGTHRVERR